MIPEAVITLLACARIGVVHSVVFGGFSADAVRSRIDDAEASWWSPQAAAPTAGSTGRRPTEVERFNRTLATEWA